MKLDSADRSSELIVTNRQIQIASSGLERWNEHVAESKLLVLRLDYIAVDNSK